MPEGALRASYTQACGDGDKQGRKPANIRPSIEFTSLQNALCAHPRFLGALISIFRRYVHAWIGNGKECNQYRLHSDSPSFAQLRSASFSSVQLCSSSLSFPQLPSSSFSFAQFGWTAFSFPQHRCASRGGRNASRPPGGGKKGASRPAGKSTTLNCLSALLLACLLANLLACCSISGLLARPLTR